MMKQLNRLRDTSDPTPDTGVHEGQPDSDRRTIGAAVRDGYSQLVEGISAFVSVGVALGKQVERLEASIAARERLDYNTPQILRLAKSGQYLTATGFLYLLLGGPDAGTTWDIESCMIGGVDANVAAAGTAGLYVVGAVNGISPGLGNEVDYAPSLPNPAFYGFRDIVLQDSEFLVAVIFGGTNLQQYVANVTATVYNVQAGGGKTINVTGQ